MTARGTGAHPPGRRLRGALAALLVLAAAACAAPVTGRPAATGSTGITAPPPESLGRLVESIRLAAATPVVGEVFPDLLPLGCATVGDLATPDIVERTTFPPGTVAPVLQEHGFVAGWRSCAGGIVHPTVALSLELADPAAARAAVTALVAASRQSDERQTTVLGGAPAQVRTDGDAEQAQIWVRVGRVVAFVGHRAAPGAALDEATRLAGIHAELLEAFEPTPQAEVPALPIDPMGLRALVAVPPGVNAVGSGPYDLAATLHSADDPVADQALLTEHGYRGSYRKSSGDGTLGYLAVLDAFPGQAQAEAVRVAQAGRTAAQRGRGPLAVPAVPDALCSAYDVTLPEADRYTQRCAVVRGGYLATVEVLDVPDPYDVTAMTALLTAQVDLIDG